jgi:hypothetical protein
LESDEEQIFDHPYPMGALIAALTFLLAFRANFAYNRYWEAVTAIHQMHSKWLDVGMDMAAFHLQCARYEKVRPPAFGEHPDLTAALGRHRAREYETTLEELEEQLNNSPDLLSKSLRSRMQRVFRRRGKRRNAAADQHALSPAELAAKAVMAMPKPKKKKKYKSISRSTAQPATSSTSFTSVFTSVFSARSKTPTPTPPPVDPANLIVRTDANRHFDQAWEHGKPPLFLQEGAHLLSLLSAVAFSTLVSSTNHPRHRTPQLLPHLLHPFPNLLRSATTWNRRILP